ncbi:MAG: diguanylate cyclase [bacterium JZ-2024 1]
MTLANETTAGLKRMGILEMPFITDSLAGFYNRRFLEKELPRQVERSRRDGVPLSVLVVDVDPFKANNDTSGHDAGDEVLRHISQRITGGSRTRASRFVAVEMRSPLWRRKQRKVWRKRLPNGCESAWKQRTSFRCVRRERLRKFLQRSALEWPACAPETRMIFVFSGKWTKGYTARNGSGATGWSFTIPVFRLLPCNEQGLR